MRWVVVAGLAGCSFEPSRTLNQEPVDVAAPRQVTTLFVTDFAANFIHRYVLDENEMDPRPELTFSLQGALSPMLVPSSGELIVSDLNTANLTRFATPLVTPTPMGAITGAGIAPQVSKMTFVDHELFLANPAAGNIDRITLDGGAATMIGGFGIGNSRGIAFDPVRRKLYVSQCCGSNAVTVFAIDANRDAQVVTTVGGLDSPHGLLITPWRELYVANTNQSAIARFALDDNGIPTPLPPISGNGLSFPLDLVLTPWNELYVANLGGGMISRFTFDGTQPIPRDSFRVPQGNQVAYFAIDTR